MIARPGKSVRVQHEIKGNYKTQQASISRTSGPDATSEPKKVANSCGIRKITEEATQT